MDSIEKEKKNCIFGEPGIGRKMGIGVGKRRKYKKKKLNIKN